MASFLAATLLPGGSEVVLAVVLALLLATLGNTLGGMSTYAMARLLPEKVSAGNTAAARYGVVAWGINAF